MKPPNTTKTPRAGTVDWYRVRAAIRDLRFQALLVQAALIDDEAGAR